MQNVQVLPQFLTERYRDWKEGSYAANSQLFERLVSDGQHPPAMIISCADSRVDSVALFGGAPGDFFLHRNVANLVPANSDDPIRLCTSSAIEYAVTALKIRHIVVLGHSGCGGVAGCHAMCSGDAPELEAADSNVGRWLDVLRPGYDRIKGSSDDEVAALEKEGIIVSLENLMSYTFVKDAVESGDLSLHGLWIDIASGSLLQYDSSAKEFVQV